MNWTIGAICKSSSHYILPTSKENLQILCKLISPSLLFGKLLITWTSGELFKINFW